MTEQSSRSAAHDADAELRRMERDWQNRIGYSLLDKPFEDEGSALVFHRQFERVERAMGIPLPGPIVEVGCGTGQFLGHLRQTEAGRDRLLIGVDVSVAVQELPSRGAVPIRADGEALPFEDESTSAVVYNGALHHVVDYRKAVQEAFRVLRPGGRLVVFEPSSTPFNRLVHHVLDPIVFRASLEYESPVDRLRKDQFSEEAVTEEVLRVATSVTCERSDFLAYPVTGCYAGSFLARFPALMRGLVGIEGVVERHRALSAVSNLFAWRFLLLADKPLGDSRGVADTVTSVNEMLVCPRCHGALEDARDREGLHCPSCHVVYRVESGIPVLLVDETERSR